MTAHFKIVARMDRSRATGGTVTIDRGAGTFSVRPHKSRREYVLPLSTVADIVVARVIKAGVAAERGRS